MPSKKISFESGDWKMKNIKFGYFSQAETDQYNFYRVPKALFTEEYFKLLSCEAKILYGLMLDRMSLSIKNQWFDSQGRAYIIFTVADVMNILGCQSQKAVRLMKELDTSDGIGLIEKKRVGLGRPNIIYVKNFMVREDGSGHKTDALRNGHSENYPPESGCKDRPGRKDDVCENQYRQPDTDVPNHTEKADMVTDVPEMEKTIGTNKQIESGKIPEMEGYVDRDAAQDQETGEPLETDWWMGDAEIPEVAEGVEDDAAQDETDWWMSEIHTEDEAFDNQNSAIPEYLSGVSSFRMKCGKQRDMVLGTGYVDSVDKWQEKGIDVDENQSSGKMDAYFRDVMSEPERESIAGVEKNGIGADGCMLGSASVLQNIRILNTGEKSVSSTETYGFKDKEAEAVWCRVFGVQPEGEYCGQTILPGETGQGFSKMNYLNDEIQDSGLVTGQTADFRNAKCNDTDTSDTEYTSKTDESKNKDSKIDFCKSYQSYQSYQSYPSYPVGQPEKKEACCAGNGKTEMDSWDTKVMAGQQLAGNQEDDSVQGRMDSYREAIRDHISYSCFQNSGSMEDVDELVELMVDTMMVPDGHTIRVAGMDKPASVVKGCFMKLAHSHIEYVMECLQKHTGKIWNIKAYLLTSLYNSVLTISNYYRAEVNHDLYGCGC